MSSTITPAAPRLGGDGDRDGTAGHRAPEGAATKHRLPGIAVAVFAAVWLASVWDQIAAPLGFSHDGQNAGVFGAAARALVDDPIGSHLGSHLANGNGVYSNHPPLLNWLLGLGHLVTGDSTAGLRLPMVVAALVLIGGTHRLLRALVSSPWAAAIGTIVGLGVPMFFVYGTMPDTPMLGLPVGVLLLGEVVLADTAGATSARPGRRWRIVTAAAGCALAGWEGVLLGVILAVVTMARARGAAAGRRPATGWLVVSGLAIGGTITFAWIAWADGGLARIADQFLFRTGASEAPFSVGEAITTQIQYLSDVYGPVIVLALVAVVPARRIPAVRRFLPVVVGVCLAYQVVFWQAASYHDYWSYWWQLPMAMCFAGALEAAATSPAGGHRRALVGAAVVLLVVGPVWTLVRSTRAERDYDRGLATARLIESTPRPADQDRVLMFGLGTPTSWASWSTDQPVVRLNLAQLSDMASLHPRWKVIAHCELKLPGRSAGLCDALPTGTRRAADLVVVDAADLEAATR